MSDLILWSFQSRYRCINTFAMAQFHHLIRRARLVALSQWGAAPHSMRVASRAKPFLEFDVGPKAIDVDWAAIGVVGRICDELVIGANPNGIKHVVAIKKIDAVF